MKILHTVSIFIILAATQVARGEIEVFLKLGSVSPSVNQGQVVASGTKFRTGPDGLIVLEESWRAQDGDLQRSGTCTRWTIISGGASKKVKSKAGSRCRRDDDLDQSIARAMNLQKTVSTVVVFVGAGGKADEITNDPRGEVARLRVLAQQVNLRNGEYTIQQKDTGRYLDAHEVNSRDYALVTRPRQNNDTQRWIISRIGPKTYTIRQKSNGRYVDAHEYRGKDYGLVTRTRQDNDTQRWIVRLDGPATYTIQQKSNNRFVDAHVTSTKDHAVVTRKAQRNDTQRWILRRK